MIEKLIGEKFGAAFASWPLEPGKPAIIFVHGAGGSHLMWLGQLAYFRREFAPLAVNLPGHGLSPGPALSTVPELARFVLGLADALKLDKFLLAGLSMGGAIAQEIALTAPERLTGLVLLSTGARLRVMPEIFKMLAENCPGYLAMFPKFAFSRQADAGVVEKSLQELSQREPKVVACDFRACDSFNRADTVKAIQIPTLIVSATQDLLTPMKYSDFLHSQIPGSQLVRISDAGHIVNLEKPDEVNGALKEFFAKLTEPK